MQNTITVQAFDNSVDNSSANAELLGLLETRNLSIQEYMPEDFMLINFPTMDFEYWEAHNNEHYAPYINQHAGYTAVQTQLLVEKLVDLYMVSYGANRVSYKHLDTPKSMFLINKRLYNMNIFHHIKSFCVANRFCKDEILIEQVDFKFDNLLSLYLTCSTENVSDDIEGSITLDVSIDLLYGNRINAFIHKMLELRAISKNVIYNMNEIGNLTNGLSMKIDAIGLNTQQLITIAEQCGLSYDHCASCPFIFFS
jgi:hypothetical protein